MSDGSYRLHDRRFTPLENTPTNHLADGGGKMTLESVFRDINNSDEDDPKLIAVDADENPRTKSELSGNEQAMFCSNGPPNIFNEAHCTLSTDPNACVRQAADDEDTVVVTKLVPVSLGKINDIAGTTLVQIEGFAFTDNTELPCGVGEMSRWMIMREATTKADCDALGSSVATETYDAFTNLLFYSVDRNEILRDVRMVSVAASRTSRVVSRAVHVCYIRWTQSRDDISSSTNNSKIWHAMLPMIPNQDLQFLSTLTPLATRTSTLKT
jgi:hypothetical protein